MPEIHKKRSKQIKAEIITNNNDMFIRYKSKSIPTANCWPCVNVVLPKSSSGVPLILVWLSYGVLTWGRSGFEEGSEVIRKYTLLTNIGSVVKLDFVFTKDPQI